MLYYIILYVWAHLRLGVLVLKLLKGRAWAQDQTPPPNLAWRPRKDVF